LIRTIEGNNSSGREKLSLWWGILEIKAPSVKWRNLVLFKVCGVLRDQGDASCSTPLNRVWILQGLILISIENYSDSDTSSESEYESSQGSVAGSD
jgi:hypothetical protein